MRERRSKAAPDRVAILGTGLIGASIGLAARASGAIVTGWDTDKRALRTAARRGALDKCASSLKSALRGSAVVILAAPLDAILTLLPRVIADADKGALVLHCAGVMTPVNLSAVRLLKRRTAVRFAAAHPIAGSERSGPAAANALLLKERVMAIHAPPQAQRRSAWADASRFAASLGMTAVRVDASEHDDAVAALSALPQLASLALALAVSSRPSRTWKSLAGPGYRDATRLASSRFAVWKPGLAANRTEILRYVERLAKRVHGIEIALRGSDWAALERTFLSAAAARRRVYRA